MCSVVNKDTVVPTKLVLHKEAFASAKLMKMNAKEMEQYGSIEEYEYNLNGKCVVIQHRPGDYLWGMGIGVFGVPTSFVYRDVDGLIADTICYIYDIDIDKEEIRDLDV